MLYTISQIRQIEQQAADQLPAGTLMQRAGQAAAAAALELLVGQNQPVLVLAGPGNNGGDAMELAAHLAGHGHTLDLLHCASAQPRTAEAEQAWLKARAAPGITWLDQNCIPDDRYALVVDGLFGTGVKPLNFSAGMRTLIGAINQFRCPVLALDVPSGLHADTGVVQDGCAICATHTITFIADKPGLHTCDGRDYAGQVQVHPLGLDAKSFPPTPITLNGPDLFGTVYRVRRHNSNKGSNGTLHLIGGSAGMQGALLLAARSALLCGAGRVLAGFVNEVPAVDMLYPEIMCRPANSLPAGPEVVTVIGPGLGQSSASFELVSRALLAEGMLIVDADALNLLASQPALMALCNGRSAATTLLTPHPLEAARLLGTGVAEVQADRIKAVRSLARRYSSTVILKGSGSLIATPDGTIVINPSGNPGLASGGTGDVLAGACGALCAQHADLRAATLAAVWLHGSAADELVEQGVGPVGLTAGELGLQMRELVNRGIPAS